MPAHSVTVSFRRPIERGISVPCLLARVLAAKYLEHAPLYRQSEIYTRQGMELSRSVLAGWVEACCRLMAPLEEVLRQYVLRSGKVHADDTPVPVLLPGNKKTKTGRLWVYVRDDRNAGSLQPPAVWFGYSPDRKGCHPQAHLTNFSGVLQVDAQGSTNFINPNVKPEQSRRQLVGRTPGEKSMTYTPARRRRQPKKPCTASASCTSSKVRSAGSRPRCGLRKGSTARNPCLWSLRAGCAKK